MRVDNAENVAFANVGSGSSADVDLPLTAFHRYGTDVLDHGLRAVPGTACCGHLHLVRSVDTFELVLNLDRQAGAITDAEATKICSNAAFAGSISFAISVPGRNTQVAPDAREVVLFDTQQIDALAAGELHHGHAVLLGDVCNAAQLGGSCHAAGHLRDNRECAVSLDIGMHPFI